MKKKAIMNERKSKIMKIIMAMKVIKSKKMKKRYKPI